MYNFFQKVAMLAVLLFAFPVDAGDKKSFWDYVESAKKKAPEVRKEAEYWFGDGKELPTKTTVGRQERSLYSQPMTKEFSSKILAIGDVIGKKGRADAISFSNGVLTVYEGWMADEDSRVTEFGSSHTYKIGYGAGYERALIGNFFGKSCNSILLYDTKNFKSLLLKNDCLKKKSSKTKFKATHIYGTRGGNLLYHRLDGMVRNFVNSFAGRYIAHAADMDGNGKDDIVFTGFYNNQWTYMTLYANAPRNRSDNLEFSHSPKGYRVERNVLPRGAKGNVIRIGDIQGDRLPELVIHNPNSSDVITYVHSLNQGVFSEGVKRKFNATYFTPAGSKIWMFDANNNGKKDLVFHKNNETLYADFSL